MTRSAPRPAARPIPKSPTPSGSALSGPSETPLPNERDEAGGSTGGVPSDAMKQAHLDLKKGLQDTDRGAVMDSTYRKQKK